MARTAPSPQIILPVFALLPFLLPEAESEPFGGLALLGDATGDMVDDDISNTSFGMMACTPLSTTQNNEFNEVRER
jgi:hypothetical protein